MIKVHQFQTWSGNKLNLWKTNHSLIKQKFKIFIGDTLNLRISFGTFS